MSDRWKRVRDDVKAKRKLSFNYGRASIPGTFTAEACHEDFPMPLAVVWFGFVGLNAIQIQNSFTFDFVRRCGLRTYIHEQLLASYPDRHILSGAGTKSGEAWMKATGYKQTKAGWEFHRKAAKA